ncbi:MAG: AtpZ/AtpI family protein [Acidimicrobiia bacterium]
MQFRRVLGVDKFNVERRRDSNTSHGVELAVTVLLFVLLGLFLDSVLGTRPWCTVGLAVFGFVGGALTAWTRYQAQMDKLDEGKPWTRKAARATQQKAA